MKYIAAVFALVILSRAQAQNIEFSAKASKYTVAADEAFKLTYTVNAQCDFTAPDLKDFKLLSGPASSSYSQINVINGQMHNSYTNTWTLIVRPRKEGEFVIPPASINYNGKVYRSNAMKMTVGKATGNAPAEEANPGTTAKANNGKNVFCTISLSKPKVYEGESMLITYKLYSRYTQIQDYDIKLSTQKDVWAQEIPAGKNGWPSYEETVNGIRYMVYPIKKELIFPQKSGTIKLEPFDMMVVARVSFFESSRFDVVSNSPELEVMPTPADAPASFINAVGTFDLEASISKEEVNVNDGIDLFMKIKGSGNLKLIRAPELNFPADFEVYDPETADKITVNQQGMTGSKDYKYLVIPRHSGTYTIDPVPFTYFNLDTKKYVTLYTPKFTVNVKKGEGESQQVGTLADNKTDVKILDKEVRYLKKYESLVKDSNYFTGSGLYYAAVGAPLVCYFLLIFLAKRKKERYDPDKEKEKKAGKKVVKQLQKAQQMLESSNTAEFYTELLRGLQAYYCEKFKVEVVDFSRQRIHDVLSSKGISEDTVRRFIALVNNCEMARYAAMQGNERSTYEEANVLVSQLEKEVKA